MKKILVIILAYEAEGQIESLLARIPSSLFSASDYRCDLLILDDASPDDTVSKARNYLSMHSLPVTLLVNPKNQGYGGNQKIGYSYAIRKGYDIAVMLHGDGQYPPERIDQLVRPLVDEQADAVMGSRMIEAGGALRGGMPLYKFIGNKVLTHIQNMLLGSHLSEFHTGFRAYSLEALQAVPFIENSNDFDFDTDILIQFLLSGKRVQEIGIPTHYGDEICHVNGIKYALQVLRNTFLARCQRRGIFYHPKFDFVSQHHEPRYQDKTGFDSSHSWAVRQVEPNSRVLDIGCGSGAYVASALVAKGCVMHAIDYVPSAPDIAGLHYRQVNLDAQEMKLTPEEKNISAVLMLDVIEHLDSPEAFIRQLRNEMQEKLPPLYLTTPNIAFIVMRLTMLLGWFNYGKRGILDMTHKRLFTVSSITRALEISGYRVERVEGIPAPMPLAIAHRGLALWLLNVNRWLIKLNKRLFSYQIAVVARPLPTLDTLIVDAELQANARN